MAGDTKETGGATLPDVSDPFPGIQATLDRIADALAGSIENGPAMFSIQAGGLIGFAGHEWQRLRVEHLIVSASAAGTATLTVGAVVTTWNIGVGVSDIPFPTTVERGVNIDLGGTAVGIAGYLIAAPE